MSPIETVLLGFALALALVGVGYWMGRTLPPLRPRTPSAHGRDRAARSADERCVAPTLDRSERLKREIDAHVQALRRAREAAEPWVAPAVDHVPLRGAEAAHAAWFADTAVEPHTTRPAH